MLIGKNIILEEIDPVNIEWMRQQRNRVELRKYFREWKDITKDRQLNWYNERGNNTNPNHVYFQIMALPKIKGSSELYSDKEMEDLKRKNFIFEEMPIEESIKQRKIIGCCGVTYIDWHLRRGELSIFITDKDESGKNIRGLGLGREAIVLMLDYAFSEMNLHRIWAEVYDNNDAVHFYRKVGFKDEGILRDSYFREGKYGNSYVLGLLEGELIK